MILGIFANSRRSGIFGVVARVLAAAGAAALADVRRLARRFAAVLAAVDGEVAACLRAMLAAPFKLVRQHSHQTPNTADSSRRFGSPTATPAAFARPALQSAFLQG